ncbi:hypothetical protein J40TS1_34080 [Paenibacillus montaniterrae]|uniref:Uncharacterized protein n=1 Tax=Paenibacillus montaniterrae TaxID=429341 RepID=A0A920CYC2_9BACL|nr:hypothetical protein [Paenibacillus montaniterrae]GIP17766.1 hypothetical protein J40TS1_34080 [Paenibacillus montaniterrae]
MITLSQVMQAICHKLTHLMPEVPIQSNDIEEGFDRPSLFVEFVDVKTATSIGNQRERNIEVTIFYFPSDRYEYEIELLEKQETLEEAFRNPFVITESFYVFPDEVDSIVTDGVLQTSFSIYLLERADQDSGAGSEMMEHLKVKVRKEG